MHYEINVIRNGKHFFATDERSITTEQEAKNIYREIRTRFPASEGFEIEVAYYETRGMPIDARAWTA